MDARLARVLELVPQLSETQERLRSTATNLAELNEARKANADLDEDAKRGALLFVECMGLMDELTDDMGLDDLTKLCDFVKAVNWLDEYAHNMLRRLIAEMN